MKKLIAFMLLSCIIFCLVACESEQETSEDFESSSQISQKPEESKPWYDTGVSIDNSSQIEVSFPEESMPEESMPEISEPEDESSTTDVPNTQAIQTITSVFPERAAVGYDIVFTKNSALNALSCYTNPNSEITAVYDGSVTRFFDAITGEYYHTEFGKWTYKCCGGFYNEEILTENSKWIRFLFEKDTDVFIKAEIDYHAHGGGAVINFYSPITAKTYSFHGAEDGYLLYEGQGAFICREMKNNYDVVTQYSNGSFDVTQVELGKYGLTNNGKVVIPFEYDNMAFYRVDWGDRTDATVGVVVAEKDGRVYYFSTNGTNLTPDGFDCGSEPCGDRAWVYEDGQGWIIKFR